MTGTLPSGSLSVAEFAAAVAPPDPHAAGWAKAADQLRALGDLEPGWDGEDAPTPPPALVSSALRLLADLRRGSGWPPPARAVATFDGTAVVEWQWPGVLVEVEVTGPGRAAGTVHADGRPTQHLTLGW